MSTNEVQSLPREPRVRVKRRRSLFVATGLLLVIGLILADWWQAHREFDQLLDAVTASKIAKGSGVNSVNTDVTNSDKNTPPGPIELKCATAAANVQDTGAQVSEVFVLPWHRSLLQAQEAYSAHSRSWQNFFAGCADDLMLWNDRSSRAEIDASGRVAHRAFTNAVPIADGKGRIRLEVIFKYFG